MSFRNYKEKIDEGDIVILYLSNNLYALDVRPEIKNTKGDMVENVYQTPFGALKVRNLIGADYGSRVELSKGWGHVLQPTPELWSLTLPHRTQIIYTPDISMILLQLDLIPGSVVVEAGTGSGSLTHALIRRVRPHGHVYTFDFHEHRAKIAREEFNEHGLADFVTTQHRDVLAEGFGEDLKAKADAVFLDLPKPWDGVTHAVAAIKEQGGRFCSFSPCIEQVQRTCLALKEHGFQDISTMEVLQNELKVTRRNVPVRDLSFLKHKFEVDKETKHVLRPDNIGDDLCSSDVLEYIIMYIIFIMYVIPIEVYQYSCNKICKDLNDKLYEWIYAHTYIRSAR
ncbi:unnamed protein product [Parnassius apollo]|uniref:tRNA (adenine(58)-N(1))-methyltransferase n=1 Tax=Parnassius apollo TaxID=110799 RepID=A0A8S3WEN5_PARAO|nr:unnamed protein product [Parnassius apollo]